MGTGTGAGVGMRANRNSSITPDPASITGDGRQGLAGRGSGSPIVGVGWCGDGGLKVWKWGCYRME